jgi:hypothetical protein
MAPKCGSSLPQWEEWQRATMFVSGNSVVLAGPHRMAHDGKAFRMSRSSHTSKASGRASEQDVVKCVLDVVRGTGWMPNT